MPLTREEAIARLTGRGAPYELREIEAGGRRIRAFTQGPRTLRELYETTSSDRTFLVLGETRLTFAQCLSAAAEIGAALVDRFGIAKGDRVAIAMRNYPEWIVAFMAITSIGGIAVAINSMWPADDLVYGLRDCGARVLFADPERLQRLAQRPPIPDLAVVGARLEPGARPDAGAVAWEDLIGPFAGAPMPAAAPGPDDGATIFYTSGSSGHPKGVLSTHRNVLAALLSWELDRRIGELVSGIEPPAGAAGGSLLAVPLFHVTGSHAVFLASYRLQRMLVCMTKWDAAEGARLIARHRLTSFIAPAAMTGDLVRVAREGHHDLSSLLVVGGGGAPRAPEQVRQIGSSFGAAMPGTGWGMTETNAIGAGIGGEDYLKRPASSGRSSLVLDLKVVDEAGASLPAGQRGELLVRGASLFAGYWREGGLDTSVFEDGWFRTGDVACFDTEGFLSIVDRIKDIIIRGGENIACAHVEAALLLHPKVREATVYAVPDARLGEEVGATVHADGSLDADELRRFAAQHLARFEVPRHILISQTPLPRTPTGKIDKRNIRAAARDAADT
ncbi:MAG: class I adenylate-forming enzyme family protein [Hyphomicrobiaceae bacterium]|nr:class I adenylate-forming enzyme family protein [Hyphomicrobiaceae bacterium]